MARQRSGRGEAAASAALVFGVAAALVGTLGAADVLSLDLRFLGMPALLSGLLAALAVVSGLTAFARRTPDRIKTAVAIVLGLLAGGVLGLLIPRVMEQLG